LWEVISNSDPIQLKPTLADLAIAIRDEGFHPPIPPFVPSFIEQIMNGCWKVDPKQRWTHEEIQKILDKASAEIRNRAKASSKSLKKAGLKPLDLTGISSAPAAAASPRFETPRTPHEVSEKVTIQAPYGLTRTDPMPVD